MPAELIVDARNTVGECPVWVPEEQALYWVDIPNGGLQRWSAATGHLAAWKAPQMLACIARSDAGNWVAGMQTGFFQLTPHNDGSLDTTPLATVDHPRADMRLNDGRCDRQGRFWAGSMVLDMGLGAAEGTLYRFAAGATPQAQLSGFITLNGLAFSPDGRTMYVSDSHPSVQQVWAFDYDLESGTPSNRRVFIDMHAHPGRPDGAAVDADGCYWICANDAGLVHRFTPEGRLDRSLSVPVKKPSMCAFGGSRLDTLFVTSIRDDHSEQSLAGGVFALNPGAQGLPEPTFACRKPG
ncbi:SMP-30/gluconolactonase/LRE family protein [Pseudomonas palleroniana]|uniref:SMP-30/gluconolactonase/LRE family protein n=1 Tax=Pseudomonas palleroniana TaxID=191390 RepID=A0A1H5NEE1_9PSED|nr:SMP-30/gluconolactonase/LRE family protein [Pseudomonas palleroniana]KAB0569947.1 SMP-30/gluconolactonase/LRE family protein [Pseudomonas palleroniana]PTC22029.1 SMP-30/gluconolactonase/LRE family protein [Pseudomonas palleroniana]UOK40720.1 SMP-30/gluconolactonase/LRE family protein [Pseudomonas palleroniana]SEE99854.1 Sugar lactone lactonase YvrE [Pseudomonas palleroniana]